MPSPQPSPLLLNPSSPAYTAAASNVRPSTVLLAPTRESPQATLPSPRSPRSHHQPLTSNPTTSPVRPAMYLSNSAFSSFGSSDSIVRRIHSSSSSPLDFSDPPEVEQAREERRAVEAVARKRQSRAHPPSSIRLPTYSPTGYPFPWVLSRPATPDLASSAEQDSTGKQDAECEDDGEDEDEEDDEVSDDLQSPFFTRSRHVSTDASSFANADEGDGGGGKFTATIDDTLKSQLADVELVDDISSGDRPDEPQVADLTSPTLNSEAASSTRAPPPCLPSPISNTGAISSKVQTPLEDVVSRSKHAGSTPGAVPPLPFVALSSASSSPPMTLKEGRMRRRSSSEEEDKPASSPPKPQPGMALRKARMGMSLSLSSSGGDSNVC